MPIGYGMHLEQTQKLVMTPELRQAIWLLQLSSFELVEEIQKQLEENPVLETAEESGNNEPVAPEAKESADEIITPPEPNTTIDPEEIVDNFDWQRLLDENTNADIEHGFREIKEKSMLQNWVASEQSLLDYLMWQLNMTVSNRCDLGIGNYLIGNIDDNGYLQVSVEEVSTDLGIIEEKVLEVLHIIHGFEPPGIGARNLQECLMLQLDTMKGVDPLVYTIVEGHLEAVAAGRVAKLADELKVSPLMVQSAVDFIAKLDPRPGKCYGSTSEIRYIVPDVLVEKEGDDFIVVLNDMVTPSLTINPYYRSLIKHKQADGEATKFIESRINSAVWFIRSIEQRKATIRKVTESIVRYQRKFFERGVRYLVPLTLKQVAADIEMHESTVSRATAQKYVQTPQGLYRLGFFFSSGLEDLCGNGVSSSAVKQFMQDIIAGEDTEHPYSDQRLVELLSQKGIEISRRTVAKYREDAGIPSSARRRRYK